MYSTNTLLLAILVALLAGAAVGALLSRRLSPDSQKHRELERNLDRLLQQQKDYQHEVVEHFSDTAKLLGNLAVSYRDVHNHLAHGATKLSGGHQTELQPIPEASIAQLGANRGLEDMQQPLDYAPKSSPHETGMLNEEFGLDKVAPEIEPELEAPIPEHA
ncbi:MAG: DUF1043 family protein [Gammaproteobacteria bacterium]|nr:DUF1043 family protein [Gammaproteobacteria bacterium]